MSSPSLQAFLRNLPFSLLQNFAQKNNVKIYLVGGALRDFILNRPCCDFDFAVSQGALKVARQFADEIRGSYVLLDKKRGCARVVKKKAEQVFTYDFADFRDKTIQGDLSKRDFTINALCIPIDNSRGRPLGVAYLDPHGGRRDIKAKRIRMVSRISFQQDPLRVVRAFSLRALLGFSIDRKTLALMKKEQYRLKDVSAERIRDELFKILSTPRAAENLKAMDRIGLLEQIIPHISVMDHVTQGTYHHLDVWPHSLETVLQLQGVFKEVKDDPQIERYLQQDLGGGRRRFALMKLAGLLHDIGKPETKKVEDGKTSFHGHERVGKMIVRKIARMLKISTKERYGLEDMVLWHLRPGYLSNFKSPSPRSIFRYFRDTKDEALSVLLLSLADQRATRGPLTTEEDQRHHEKIVKSLIQQYLEEQKKEPFVRLIDGHDLIRQLRLKPSPLFGKILKEVQEQQVLGKIQTKEEALVLAKGIAQKELKRYERIGQSRKA